MTGATPWLRDDEGRLAEDIDCRVCQYNLRGLMLEGTCPECRTPVGRSVHPKLLRFADQRWLKRLVWGTAMLLVAVAATVPLVFVAGVLMMDSAGAAPGGWSLLETGHTKY